MTMRWLWLLRGLYLDNTMPMARRRTRRTRLADAVEAAVLLAFHVVLFGGALGSVLLLLWLSAPGGR